MWEAEDRVFSSRRQISSPFHRSWVCFLRKMSYFQHFTASEGRPSGGVGRWAQIDLTIRGVGRCVRAISVVWPAIPRCLFLWAGPYVTETSGCAGTMPPECAGTRLRVCAGMMRRACGGTSSAATLERCVRTFYTPYASGLTGNDARACAGPMRRGSSRGRLGRRASASTLFLLDKLSTLSTPRRSTSSSPTARCRPRAISGPDHVGILGGRSSSVFRWSS